MKRADVDLLIAGLGRARSSAAPGPLTPAVEREFEVVALVHRARLHRTALGLCRNPTEAEAQVQETYLRAFRRFDSFVPGTNCLAWLHTILRNVFINRVVRGGREVPAGDACAVECGVASRALAAPTATPEEEFFRRVLDDRELARALDALPPSFRAVVLLADVEGRSYREIAELCEVPVGTVMSRLFRARRRLRRAFRGRAEASNGRAREMPRPRAILSHPVAPMAGRSDVNGCRPSPGDLATRNWRTCPVVAEVAGRRA
ncbi:MAG: sigma-70 family RNA polymerase sigma factor [Candidatus Rokubacteria bacterium]|nr:sigma-70 family RNA polymerase sigma factor [Candidatus Rokubacteria bacterium]